ncbi:MAG: LON peptidase substrate-binding domain-containing protein [Chloroflexi bacterium]|nr:LON peptidase substrate-binding domain-containing protein [Chloroflexota bacterium]
MSHTRELPLFPLNTVLFPGMPLYLHIFEPRYKLMISECLREARPFGVVLISEGSEVSPNVSIYTVGTTAHITHIKPLADGEMNIASIGQRRFRILSTHNRHPYLSGIVEDYPIAGRGDARIPLLVNRLTPLIKRYLGFFASLGEVDSKIDRLPDDPEMLAYLTAIILNVPPRDKQRLLEIATLPELLSVEYEMLRREALFLKHIVENGSRWRDDTSPFSPN